MSDQWYLRFDSAIEFKRYEKTDEGYLKVFGVAAATGIMEYTNEDGSIRRELADDKALEEAAEGLIHQPITVEHPKVPGGMLNSTNVRNYQVGEVIESRYNADAGENEVVLLVRDDRTVRKIEDRELLGLSPGYSLQREPAPKGAGFDFVQRNRRYNHLALTKKPRKGAQTSIRLDSADNVIISPENTTMPKETEGAENKPITEPPAPVSLDSLEGKVDSLAATVQTLAATVQALVPEEPADDEANTDADEQAALIAACNERNKATAVAKELEVEFDANADSTDEIKRKIVSAHMGDAFNADATAGYIDAAFSYVQKDSETRQKEAGSLDSFAASFDLPGGGKPNADSRKFVDPTALEHMRGRKSNLSNSEG